MFNFECENFFEPVSRLKLLVFKIISLPFVALGLLILTFFRAVSLVWSFLGLILSFGMNVDLQDFFIRRVELMAHDVAQWVLFPFRFLKLLLSSLVFRNFIL